MKKEQRRSATKGFMAAIILAFMEFLVCITGCGPEGPYVTFAAHRNLGNSVIATLSGTKDLFMP